MKFGVRVLFFLLLCSLSYGISISDLIQKPREKAIEIEGEVVGKPMKRKNFYLLNIYDKTGAIGVFIRLDKCPKISYYGRYGVMGDKIRVSGIFHPACKEHGGKMDIHASSIEVLEKGRRIEKPVSRTKLGILAILSLLALLLIFVRKRYASN
ncbi:MAG: DNA-binding protein [bacterium]